MHNPTLANEKKAVISMEPPSTQTGLIVLPCDRACNSNITADHFYSVRALKQSNFDPVINEVQGEFLRT